MRLHNRFRELAPETVPQNMQSEQVCYILKYNYQG